MTAPVFAIGDIVTSKWSSTGALWEVTEVDESPALGSRVGARLTLVSVNSGRHDKRYASNLKLAPAAAKIVAPSKRIAAAIDFVNEFGAWTEGGDNVSAELIAILEGKSA